MKSGFYTALGTPLDEQGNLLSKSLTDQIHMQISAGVSGLLVMGSMGIQACIKDSQYTQIASTTVEATGGACPVMVGVMDNSIGRVLDRINSLSGLNIDGVVATTPFYYIANQNELIRFFTTIADNSPFPVFIYDLPVITKTKVDQSTAEKLAAHPNIRGIKTGDLFTAKYLHNLSKDYAFSILYSDLNLQDVAFCYGIDKGLDGMYTLTAPLGAEMYSNLREGKLKEAKDCLDKILNLRNAMISIGLWRAYSYAMNLLGWPGLYAPDYTVPIPDDRLEIIKHKMVEFGLIAS